MASESESASSLMENLMNSRNIDLSLFLPFILSITNNPISSNSVQDSSNPDEETDESTTPSEFSDRIILVNPLTQNMIVMETRSSTTLDSFLNELMSKEGQPPASKASIDALTSVEICEEGEKGECSICLDDWVIGGVVKEMPYKSLLFIKLESNHYPAAFTFNPIHRLRALYAQSFRRTLAPPSYRGCWHGVSRGFFLESCHDRALDAPFLKLFRMLYLC
ncbi:hypothetical protein KY289_023239 [Solanum tuberosum]|nr:hypothetical protein KY289_023239 [Solanum tuberosum]